MKEELVILNVVQNKFCTALTEFQATTGNTNFEETGHSETEQLEVISVEVQQPQYCPRGAGVFSNYPKFSLLKDFR